MDQADKAAVALRVCSLPLTVWAAKNRGIMGTRVLTCRYCAAALEAVPKRCRECGSWLSWRAHVLYPETLWAAVGLVISIVAAAVAWVQAVDARAERRAAEALRKDINTVAEQVTKMAFVVADGSGRFGGFPKVHLEQVERYREAMRPYLPPGLEGEIANTIRELNERIRQESERR